MARAESTKKTEACWNYTRARRMAFVVLGHLGTMSIAAAQERRHTRVATPRQTRRLWAGWEVYAEARSDEFYGGHTHEEECEFEDMLRLAGRL